MRRRFVILAGLLVAAPALAGTELVIETRQAGENARPTRSVVEVEGRQIHAEWGDGKHGALWNAELGVLQILDHAEKSVFRVDRATAKSVRDGLDQLPPGSREAVERWVGAKPPAKVELRSTGKSAEVTGVSCRLLDAYRDGERLAEVCEGPSSAAGVTPATLAPARELAAFLAEVGDLLPRSLTGEGLDALVLVDRVQGVPLRVRAWPKDAPATESRLVSAVPKSFAPARFQPPPGYSAGLGVHVRQ